jgi:signal transduction histidine kinase
MSLRLLDWNLRHKIILHVVVIGMIAGIIMTYFYLSTQQNIITELNQQKAELVGSMIECNTTHQMQVGRPKDIGPSLQRIAESNNIESLRLIDAKGKIRRSSNPDDIGKYIEESQIKKMAEFYSTLEKTQAREIRPVSSYKSFYAIRNKNECFACHDPEIKVIGILEVNLEEAATAELIYKNQLRAIVISLIALAILIFIILRLFEKIINRPLSDLKDQMKKIQGGNLGVRLQPKKNDDIGDLVKSFNIMVANLKRAHKKIEELHSRELERAGHLASMGEMAAGLAHEIKNPIAGIKGALEVISQRTDANAPEKEIFTEILHQTDRIYNIVQDLLSYARPKEVRLKPADPTECIQRAVNLAQSQTQEKDVRFRFERSTEEMHILCDENKIQEVILNLLINSIAAIEDKGEISIDMTRKNEEWLEITIKDDGKGIKTEHLSQVFNPFFTTRRRGTGLGLSICKKTIEAHSGSINVQSEMGKGTVFTIRLPLTNKAK